MAPPVRVNDEAWTRFGIINNSWQCYEPKKRYFALRQIYRFAKPDFIVIDSSTDHPGIHCVAFMSQDKKELTVTGYSDLNEDVYLNLDVSRLCGLEESDFDVFRTSIKENCVLDKPMRIMQRRLPFSGIETILPAEGIFTITNVK